MESWFKGTVAKPANLAGTFPPSNRYVYNKQINQYVRASDTSAAAQIIPNTLYDIEFQVLQQAVFAIDHRSATPIAQLMSQKFTKTQIHQFVTDANSTNTVEKEPGYGKLDRISCQYLYSDTRRQTQREIELLKAKLREKVEEFRKMHGVQLRDLNLRDVEIMYSGTIMDTFKKDKAVIQDEGGKAYHILPWKKGVNEIGMIAILKAETLNKLYPAERLGVNITAMTEPAAEGEPEPEPEFKGVMFPLLKSRPQRTIEQGHGGREEDVGMGESSPEEVEEAKSA